MLVEQIDVIDAEPEKRGVGNLADAFGPTIGSAGRLPRKVHTKFRRDNGVVPAPLERPPEEFLVDIRAIGLRSVKEGDTEINCAVDRRDRLRLIRFAVILAHSHAAEAESRNFQAAISKFALLHCFSWGTVSLISTLESGAVEAVSRSFRFIVCFSFTVAPPQSEQLAWRVEMSETITMKNRSGVAS